MSVVLLHPSNPTVGESSDTLHWLSTPPVSLNTSAPSSCCGTSLGPAGEVGGGALQLPPGRLGLGL